MDVRPTDLRTSIALMAAIVGDSRLGNIVSIRTSACHGIPESFGTRCYSGAACDQWIATSISGRCFLTRSATRRR